MDRPTAELYRLDSRVNWVGLGLPVLSPDLILQDEIDDAWAYVSEKTCTNLDALDALSNKGRLARKAIKLRTVQQAVQGRGAYMTSAIDRLIKSFAVPGYSETRESPGGMDMKSVYSYINDWPVLSDLLWLMMDETCRQKWLDLFRNENAPASAITEHDWFNNGSPMYIPGRFDY